jgi:hypothetical protein
MGSTMLPGTLALIDDDDAAHRQLDQAAGKLKKPGSA